MAIYSEDEDPNVEMWNKQNNPNYEFVNDFGNKVSCRPFTNANWSGIEVNVEGNRLGSMVGETLPDPVDEQEVEDFESRVTDWIIENE